MKSDGTRRAIIIAVLCLFSIAMLFMTASAWGLKAFARFAEFMTGDRIFLRILAGLGFGGLSAGTGGTGAAGTVGGLLTLEAKHIVHRVSP